jgi:cellulose synthase/poly-beta-1,6-N-acetylglucosamine synthase-like glycosyltransferase
LEVSDDAGSFRRSSGRAQHRRIDGLVSVRRLAPVSVPTVVDRPEALDRSDIGDLDVIVVDNDSSDSTRDVIPREFPHVRFIPLSSNVGFPAANNVALPLARGAFVLLLNPDTEVAPDCLRRCVDAFDRDPGIGMVGCRLVSPSGDIQYECACNMPSIADAFGEALYLNVLLPAPPGVWQAPDVLSGSRERPVRTAYLRGVHDASYGSAA